MKRIVCITLMALLCMGNAFADEGMWMLPLLQKMNSKAMKSSGCKLSPEDIYSINHSSLKDAVVQFGGGCTGEIISNEGLLVTNHHCGYSSIQKLSSLEHNYLADGYWAMNRSEELPAEGLTVTFLEHMTDISATLGKAEAKARKENKKASDMEARIERAREDALKGLIEAEKAAYPGCEVDVQSFYDENVQYLIVTKTYTDVRFVGAPPSSIGKFGADTDNWMWPRHTCDFSMFRVYAGKDNQPAPYSKDNVPYQPKSSLKLSLAGLQEGDFAMIMGYPGRTMRFQTSPELEQMLQVNDIRIAARTIRQNVMMEDMLADPAIKLQYASKYSGSSNGWKKWQGMKEAFGKLDILERAKKDEADFVAWCKMDPQRRGQYVSSPASIKKAVAASDEAYKAVILAQESLMKIELVTFATRFNAVFGRQMVTLKDSVAAVKAAAEAVLPMYKDYSLATDFKETKALTEYYRQNARPADMPKLSGYDFATMNVAAFAEDLFAKSAFTGVTELKDVVNGSNPLKIFKDPALDLAQAVRNVVSTRLDDVNKGEEELAKGRKLYTGGILEWKKDQPSYPDANFTMRLTYGTVKPYSPKDAVMYKCFTTLTGVMEKEDPDNWEFVVPAKLKDLYKARDYGRYAAADGSMPVCFLTDCDITGGNSGSPVMNAKGELVGLAFDGNWEAMSGDVMFEPQLQRCICVDIRYVMFIVDKFGGAGYLLNEMNITE